MVTTVRKCGSCAASDVRTKPCAGAFDHVTRWAHARTSHPRPHYQLGNDPRRQLSLWIARLDEESIVHSESSAWEGDLPAQALMASLGGSGLDSIMFDSGAGYSASPTTCSQEHGTKLGNKITFRTASTERLENFGSLSVPHWNPLSHGTVGHPLGGHRCVRTSRMSLFYERCRVHRGVLSRRLLDRVQDANTRKCHFGHCSQIPHFLAGLAPEPANHWRHMQCPCRSDVKMRQAHHT